MMQHSPPHAPLLDVRDLSVGLTNRHGAFLAAETQKWSTVARTASIKVE